MAEVKTVVILNQREGKFVLPPDAEALKRDPQAKPRELLSGNTIEVDAVMAAKLLQHKGLVDASTIIEPGSEVKRLKAQLAAAQAENAKLREKAGDVDEDADLGDGDAVVTPAGDKGVIVKMKKKGRCDVKLDNGNTSEFALKDLKADPDAQK